MKYVILGSCTIANLPEEIDKFFKDGHLIDPRNGYWMEMDSYSLFLYAIHSENKELANRIVAGLISNIDASSGFWKHHMWSESEVHLRFTSAGIRTLMFAYEKGFDIEKSLISDLLEKHLSFFDLNELGLWFLHDSLEKKKTYFTRNIPFKKKRVHSANMLVLNTHIDTLITAKKGQQLGILRDETNIQKGLEAFANLLEVASSKNKYWFFDHYVRELVFFVFSLKKRRSIERLIALIVKGYFVLFRLPFKNKFPKFFLDDGYIERDLCLSGLSFEYHIVNMWDIAKFCFHYNDFGDTQMTTFISFLIDKIEKGMNYITRSNYLKYIISEASKGKNGGAIEVCETLVLLFNFGRTSSELQGLYFIIREVLPPSAALKSYDPLVNCKRNSYTDKFSHDPKFDLIWLISGAYFYCNIGEQKVDLPSGKRIDAKSYGLLTEKLV